MMNAKIVAIIFIFVNNFRFCQSKSYANYSLFNVYPTEKEHLKFLRNIDLRKYMDVVFWRKPYRLFENIQLIVNPVDKELFLERASIIKLKMKLLMKDVQSAFEDQTIRRVYRLRTDTFSWDTYHSLEDIYQWISNIAIKFPSIVEMKSIGKSSEGRDIFAVSIKKGKPHFQVIVEGGIHGNEWISVEFVIYLLDQLIKSVEGSGDNRLYALIEKYEWHLVPIVNPDGYIYSQTTDRMWRKNRRALGGNLFGIDLNRNFDYSFGKYGTTTDESDMFYCGPRPFSEPETSALADFVAIEKLKAKGLKFYFAIHGYGQKIIIPYADRIKHIDNFGEAENFARQAIYEMYLKHKVHYGIGTIFDTVGLRVSGNSASFIKKTHNVRFVYSLYLRDNGTYGYALPPAQILPTCQEALTGIIALMTAKHRKMKMQLFNQGDQLKESNILIIFLICILLQIFIGSV